MGKTATPNSIYFTSKLNLSNPETASALTKKVLFSPCSWAILFSHPADFTPVCTTELGCVAQLDKEFSDRGVKMIALSCDDVQSHKDWIKDVNAYSGRDKFPYPIIADPKREIAVNLGLIDPEEKDSKGLPLTCRSVS